MMTEGAKPNNTRTYEIDVDDVGNVPDCTQIQNDKTGNVYSTPFQTEPVYESPLGLGITTSTETAQKRESYQQNGGRLRANELYEPTNDDTLLRSYTGYSYVANTDCVMPRLPKARFSHDNPVRVTDGEDGSHEYEENFRNSRFSQNVVYSDSRASEAYTVLGIRDTKNGVARNSWSSMGSAKQRTTCVQKITLLLSILALLVGILALLVALRTIKFKDVENKHVIGAAQEIRGGEPDKNIGENKETPDIELLNKVENEVLSLKQNYTELLEKYNEMAKQDLSLKQNYTKLLQKYNEIMKLEKSHDELLSKYNDTKVEVLLLKQNYSNLQARYDEMTNQFNSELDVVNDFSHQLAHDVKSINSTFTKQIRNVSKQIGPRGFNGSQGLPGPQGPQGVGNMSACIVAEKSNENVLDKTVLVRVNHDQHKGRKVISAVCSTGQYAGSLHTVLSVKGNRYTCTCAHPATQPPYKPTSRDKKGTKYMKCTIIYWECPVPT